ncbi:helix-turn-helix domain-containing protein [Microbaculum marinum]|uniref:Helix-turn-helix domain-containing protein n=1 Tax=Microbaculum marinum TaxID=1764581 RepID=A0AAW9RLT0_9HYPH
MADTRTREDLLAETEYLRECLRYYEELPAVRDWPPRHVLGLTPSEGGVLRLLVDHGELTHERLNHHCYGYPDKIPENPKLPHVFICKVRKKLRPHGIEIETIRGEGYRISPEHRARVRALEAERAAA